MGFADAEDLTGVGEGLLDRPARRIAGHQLLNAGGEVGGDQGQAVAAVVVVGAGLVVTDQDDAHGAGMERALPQADHLGDLHGIGASIAAYLCGAPRGGGREVARGAQPVTLTGHPDGTRIIVRRERAHPGAQLSLFDLDAGLRHQAFLTDTPYGEGSLQHLEVRHRAQARIEDRIRCGKTTGFGRFPSRHFAINAAWLELSLTAIDLLAWTQTLLLDGELATAEPKKLRYRLLHAAARLTRGGRQLRLRIAARNDPCTPEKERNHHAASQCDRPRQAQWLHSTAPVAAT